MHFLSRTFSTVFAIACFSLPGLGGAAEKPADGDIRSLTIGMHVSDIPAEKFERLQCAAAGDSGQVATLGSFDEYTICAPDSDGLTSVQVHYAPVEPWSKISDRFEGTRIAGHPVNLFVRIDPNGTLRALRAETDPDVRRYLHKKAFLLALRIKGRYGREDWACKREQPSADKHKVGGMFIDETCEKQLDGRHLLVHTRLYRKEGQSMQDFTGSTEFEILGPGVQPG